MSKPSRIWLKPWSVNGTGIRLLGYRPVASGVYEVSRWLTVFFVPLLPISTWVIRPGHSEANGLGSTQHFQILENRRLRLADVARTYGKTLLALLPLGLAIGNEQVKLVPSIVGPLYIAAAAWLVAAIGYTEFKAHKLYRQPPSQPVPAGGAVPPRRAA